MKTHSKTFENVMQKALDTKRQKCLSSMVRQHHIARNFATAMLHELLVEHHELSQRASVRFSTIFGSHLEINNATVFLDQVVFVALTMLVECRASG
jgi:hypothetical protein